jgi:hypothetical protein
MAANPHAQEGFHLAGGMRHAKRDRAVPNWAAVVSEPRPPLGNVRIFLAEDNIINQKVALGQLRKLGHRADAVASGFEVLAALKLLPYDVILMDCEMSEMDGCVATRAIHMGATFRAPLSLEGAHLHNCRDGPGHAGRPRKVPGGGHGRLLEQADTSGRTAGRAGTREAGAQPLIQVLPNKLNFTKRTPLR